MTVERRGIVAKGFDRDGSVVTVGADRGAARLAAEAGRVARMLADATPPEAMRAAPVAPARGAQRLVTEMQALPGGVRRIVGQHWEEADVFTAMMRDAVARHGAAAGDAPFVAPFTPGQIAMARHYRHLTERHAAGGMKCASLESRGGGGGAGGDFMDAYLAEGRELARLHRCIGAGEAMVLRRIRPSARGTRRGIGTRALVDRVCLADESLADVLRAHGWAVKGEHRAALRVVLCAALDRMQGYR